MCGEGRGGAARITKTREQGASDILFIQLVYVQYQTSLNIIITSIILQLDPVCDNSD